MPPAIPYPIMLYSAPMAWPAARKRKKKKKVIADFKREGGGVGEMCCMSGGRTHENIK